MLVARYLRRGAGRLSRKGALEIVDRILCGSMGGTDFLDGRRLYRQWQNLAILRPEVRRATIARMRSLAGAQFCHYGPRYGVWPGDFQFHADRGPSRCTCSLCLP